MRENGAISKFDFLINPWSILLIELLVYYITWLVNLGRLINLITVGIQCLIPTHRCTGPP